MAKFAVLISLLSIFGLVIGLFFPGLALRWYPGRRSRFVVLRVYLFSLLLSFMVYVVSTSA